MQLADEFTLRSTQCTRDALSITGLPPGFTVAQGEQVFNVYQKGENGEPDVVIGSFRGYVTTTSDAIGTYTQAIVVAEVLTGLKGTGPGEFRRSAPYIT